ncbi:MAG: hypothetical protein K9I71_10530 [Ignavibacteriales bacterium]|nr:hypothetical protein [Ignavibacteriales bacterium]MCF8437476.1 hypothetical protein [Ignavibacteriales bacterium]
MKILKYIALIFILIHGTGILLANDKDWVMRVKGAWKFSIGDEAAWKNPNYDDRDWDQIKVPSSWERQGYHGYDGYAWYRKWFEVSDVVKDGAYFLSLGYIDDVDEVYLNGELIGSTGVFPPDYATAYNAHREYPIPKNLLKKSGNLIAVRVYDAELDGGIMSGDQGILKYHSELKTLIDLSGFWKFKSGDNKDWAAPAANDSDWEELLVPGYWDNQGYRNYDGFGWYRIEFVVPEKYKNEKLVLALGKIDDIDEVYLNGKKVGSTGQMDDDPFFIDTYDEYSKYRSYYLKSGDLRFGKKNVIAVRVYDGYKDGGIYEGPVGIARQTDYAKFWREQNRKKSVWEIMFGN